MAEHLPPPPEVIEIDEDNDFVYVPPVTPFIKQEPTNFPAVSPSPPMPSSLSSRTSARPRRPPGYLANYHMFTTVAEECHLPLELPYHTAGGTDVDLAIHDEERMAHLCHFVMVHTATSMELARQGHPTKKQYSLKAGLKRFGSRGDKAVRKELSQLHTLNCFCPCDPASLTRNDRYNALSSLMFLTENNPGKSKLKLAQTGVSNVNMWLKRKRQPRLLLRRRSLFRAPSMLMKTEMLPPATSPALFSKPITLIWS